MDNLLMFSLVGYIFQLFGLVAIVAAAGAALYAAVQVKKAAEELRKQTALLRRLAGEQAEEKPAEE
jgi:cell division protein FtsB